jgi:hypothetical protein
MKITYFVYYTVYFNRVNIKDLTTIYTVIIERIIQRIIERNYKEKLYREL